MEAGANQQKLKELTEVVLSDETDISSAIDALAKLYYEASRLTGGGAADISDRLDPCGVALSPVQAARCFHDLNRTRVFMRGLRAAILSVLSAEPRPVHVCEVGSGPFAPLVTTVASTFSSEEMRFSVADINIESIECVQRCVRFFGLENHFLGATQCDATYSRNFKPNPRIFVVECMDAGLLNETQVPIQRNLVAGFPRALILPEQISVGFEVGERAAPLIQLDRASIEEKSGETAARHGRSKLLLQSPVFVAEGPHLSLHTEVAVFGEHRLGPDEAIITRTLKTPVPAHLQGKRVRFQYYLGGKLYELDWNQN